MQPTSNINKGMGKVYDSDRAKTIKRLAYDFKCTESYVRQCLNGTKNTVKGESIKKAFKELYNKAKSVFSN